MKLVNSLWSVKATVIHMSNINIVGLRIQPCNCPKTNLETVTATSLRVRGGHKISRICLGSSRYNFYQSSRRHLSDTIRIIEDRPSENGSGCPFLRIC